MRILQLEPAAREALLADLASMPDFLASSFDGLSPEEAATPGANEMFSPVEHCWHLADLEVEGYAVRIRRLIEEDQPVLADFDGAQVAATRDYKSRSLQEGIAVFRAARRDTLAALARVHRAQWTRSGVQEGVGPLQLCDIPAMRAAHDASHRAEIEAWRAARG